MLNNYQTVTTQCGVFVESTLSGARKYLGRADDKDAVKLAEETTKRWNAASEVYGKFHPSTQSNGKAATGCGR
jgi:hypothetical protein